MSDSTNEAEQETAATGLASTGLASKGLVSKGLVSKGLVSKGLASTGLVSKVLTVSDGVFHGAREDRSGQVLVDLLAANGFDVVELRVTADGVESVAEALAEMSDGFVGLVVSTGGTGFTDRDLTPEGTRVVIDREAPGLAEAMRLVNPLGRLSRGIAGTRGRTLILNTPGSPKGCVECLEAVIDILPHALRLLAGTPTDH